MRDIEHPSRVNKYEKKNKGTFIKTILSNKLVNLDKTEKFLGTHKLPKITEE